MVDDHIPSLIHGRYQFVSELGRGGMGRVVLVDDLREGVQRALKWVPAEGDDVPAEAVRQLREYQILSRFQHPNLLRVFEYGRVHPGGGYFFTSECLTGPTLREIVGGVAPDHVRRILVELFRGLGFLHRQGWVHGDIKPDNLRLRSPIGDRHSDLCLLDFGLAHPEGRPPEEKILGTVHYMPPERLLGGRIDRRGDLYSAGVLAFQVLTGRLPFSGSRKTEIFEGHLRQAPPDPRALAPDLPGDIAGVLHALLEKRPEDRPEDAEAVLKILHRHWNDIPAPETQDSIVAHVRVREEGLWEGPIAQVLRRVRERAGEGGLVFRRWLRTAAAETTTSRPMRAASISSSAGSAGMVIVRSRDRGDLRSFRERVLQQLQAQGQAVLTWDASGPDAVARFDAEVRAMAGHHLPQPGEEPAPIDELLHTLAELTESTAVTVILDGVDEGRDETFALLGEAVAQDRRIEGLSNVAWVALVDQYPGAWFAEWLARSDVQRWSRTVDLPRLDVEGVEVTLRQYFPGWDPPPSTCDRLLEDSQGSPSQLERRLVEFVRQGGITRSWGTWVACEIPPPESRPIVERAARAVTELAPEERGLLEALAVLDREAEPTELQRVASLPAGRTPELLISLTRSGWLDREPEAGRYRFRRRFQGIGVTAAMGPERSQELHRACGDLVEEQQGELGSEEDWAQLARHRIDADQLRAAWLPLLQFVESGAREGDPAERILLVERFLEADARNPVPGLTSEHRGVLNDGLGALRLRHGDVEGAEREWRTAERHFSDVAVSPRRFGRLQTRLGGLLLRKGEVADALPRLHGSLRELAAVDRGDLLRRHFLLLAEANLQRGEPSASKEIWSTLEQIAPPHDPHIDAEGVLLRADHAIALGQGLLARKVLSSGLVRIEGSGERNAGWSAWLLGRRYDVERRPADARMQYQLAAEIFQRQQQPLWEARALLDHARALRDARLSGSAERALLRAERQLHRAGGRSDRPRLLWLRSSLLADGGWVKEARGSLIELAEWGGRLPQAPWRWEAAFLEAGLHLRSGHLRRAAELLEGSAHPRQAPHAHLGETWARWGVLAMRLALRRGRPAGALRIADESTGVARERTDAFGLRPLWEERVAILRTLGCLEDSERIVRQLGLQNPDEDREIPDSEAGGEELAQHYSRLADEAERTGNIAQAAVHLEEALFHSLRVRALPLGAILPLRLALVRGRDDRGSETTARQAWRRLVRSEVRLGRVEVLCLWARSRARAGDERSASSLRRAAVREIARWSENVPLAHDLFTLARGLDADNAVLEAITDAVRVV